MAARLRKTHQEDVKKKIQVSYIINRLQDNLKGKIELTNGQIRSAQILLDKTISNAAQLVESKTELSGTVITKIERHIVHSKD